ncbi:TPA: hypothetical protein MJC92_000252 [Clostridioides difficile]|uniref:hypothetical protein n=1 Tax=Clostridioides difficile TaxID=1496 RepID=UPI00038D3C2B|nr:hypothetical protein [Clostridioides difficile]EQG35304.1 hypothetical protein QIK_3926 [Clostridioides difficile DA00126]EQG92191.1 hypothetical protein QKK_2010 [Clostridioides difficile DA00191]MCL1007204.1 hypothetical protein [Clostridioides difficile]MCR1601232.1 hypothetical protein [Clostridioides difficile]MDV9537647.1 hypothetical protein [Clostridioides difficile]
MKLQKDTGEKITRDLELKILANKDKNSFLNFCKLKELSNKDIKFILENTYIKKYIRKSILKKEYVIKVKSITLKKNDKLLIFCKDKNLSKEDILFILQNIILHKEFINIMKKKDKYEIKIAILMSILGIILSLISLIFI